jgi:hypothetical protein
LRPVTAAVFDIYGYTWSQIKPASTGDKNLATGAPLSVIPAGTLFTTGDGTVYVADNFSGVVKKQWISAATFSQLGYTWSQIVRIPSNAAPAETAPGYYSASQHPSGSLVKMNSGVYLLDSTSSHYLSLLAFNSYRFKWENTVTATAADVALPAGSPAAIRQGTILYSSGNIYLVDSDSSGTLKRPVGPWECYANRLHYSASDWLTTSANGLPVRTGSLFTC